MIQNKCQYCGNDFKSKSYRAKWCTQKCKARYHRSKNAPPLNMLQCVLCGRKLNTNNIQTLYCSNKCKNTARKIRLLKQLQEKSQCQCGGYLKNAQNIIYCNGCGLLETAKHGKYHQKYVSVRHFWRIQRRFNGRFTAYKNRIDYDTSIEDDAPF